MTWKSQFNGTSRGENNCKGWSRTVGSWKEIAGADNPYQRWGRRKRGMWKKSSALSSRVWICRRLLTLGHSDYTLPPSTTITVSWIIQDTVLSIESSGSSKTFWAQSRTPPSSWVIIVGGHRSSLSRVSSSSSTHLLLEIFLSHHLCELSYPQACRQQLIFIIVPLNQLEIALRIIATTHLVLRFPKTTRILLRCYFYFSTGFGTSLGLNITFW